LPRAIPESRGKRESKCFSGKNAEHAFLFKEEFEYVLVNYFTMTLL
jgi:hypothetical protein